MKTINDIVTVLPIDVAATPLIVESGKQSWFLCIPDIVKAGSQGGNCQNANNDK